MALIGPIVQSNGDVRIYAGEPLAIELQIINQQGAYADLTGRVFVMAAFTAFDGAVLYDVMARGAGTSAFLLLTGEQTEALYPISFKTLCIEIVELLEDGISPILEGRLKILPRAGAFSPALSPGVGASPVTQITFAEASNRLVVSQRGAPGLSAFQQLAMAGVISEPTVQAFVAWVTSIVAAGQAPSLDFSDPNNSGLISQI